MYDTFLLFIDRYIHNILSIFYWLCLEWISQRNYTSDNAWKFIILFIIFNYIYLIDTCLLLSSMNKSIISFSHSYN